MKLKQSFESTVDVKAVYEKRFQRYFLEASSYWRLIGSSGLLFTVTTLLILAIVYYEDFIAWIPEAVPVDLILAIFFGAGSAFGAHRTFLKEADIIFLTPLERRMDSYFSKAFVYNYIVHSIGLFVLLLLLAPLYVARVDQSSFLFYFLIPVLLKGWNLHGTWVYYRHPSRAEQKKWFFLRLLFSIFLLYWFFTEGGIFGYLIGAAVISCFLILFYFFEKKVREQYPYQWYTLLEVEERLKSRFYSFVQAFVDVPHLTHEVKQRKWASAWAKGLRHTKQNAYRYLYLHTYLRTGDYFGRTIRLTVLGSFFIYWLPNLWAQVLALGAIIVLTAVQLKALRQHHTRHFWHSVLPLPQKEHEKSFKWLRNGILLGQAFIMLIAVGVRLLI